MPESDLANPDDALLNEPAGEAADFDPFGEDTGGFEARPFTHVIGSDGGPVPVDETTQSDIPRLGREALICMGDFTTFVFRDAWGTVLQEFQPSEVEQAPNGYWRVAADKLSPKLLDEIRLEWPRAVSWVRVQPIVPSCEHYARQIAQGGAFNLPQGEPIRMCTARRNPAGAFVDLSDKGVWACDLRSPRDLTSERKLDAFDTRKISEGKSRIYIPLIGAGPPRPPPQEPAPAERTTP
jgi:hypothetical protein